MLTIVQRGGATREKPPEVVRRSACRLPWAWDGLCFGVPFNDATRDAARDLVTNAAPSEWVGTPSWTKDDRGNVAANLPNDAYVGYADNPAHNRPITAITAYLRLRRIATAPVGAPFFSKQLAANTATPVTWNMQSTDNTASQLAAALTINSATYYWENTTYTTDTSTWFSVFLRWASGTSPVQDILGERGQTLSNAPWGANVSGTLTYAAAQPIRINVGERVPPEMWTYQGAYSQAMLWSRRLSDTELQALVADPFGWYSPRRETVGLSSPYPLVFGGGEMRGGTEIGGLR